MPDLSGLDADPGPAAQHTISACPACGRLLAEETLLCIACGYDRRSGKKAQLRMELAPRTKKTGRALLHRPMFWIASTLTALGCVAAIYPFAAFVAGWMLALPAGAFILLCASMSLGAGAKRSDVYQSLRFLPWIRLPFYFFFGLTALLQEPDIRSVFWRRTRFGFWILAVGLLLFARDYRFIQQNGFAPLATKTADHPAPAPAPRLPGQVLAHPGGFGAAPEAATGPGAASPGGRPLVQEQSDGTFNIGSFNLAPPAGFSRDPSAPANVLRWISAADGGRSSLRVAVRPGIGASARGGATLPINGIQFNRISFSMTPQVEA